MRVRLLFGFSIGGRHGLAFTWNGKNAAGISQPAGTYTIKIGATDATGTTVKVETGVSGKVDEVATNEQSTFLPSSAEATRVIERLPDFTEGDTIPAVVVVTSATGFDEDRVAELQRLAEAISALDAGGETSPPILSDDGAAAQIFVPIDSDGEVRDSVERIRALVHEDLGDGLEAWVTGPAGEKWEVYTVLADSETFGSRPSLLAEDSENGVCCGSTAGSAAACC